MKDLQLQELTVSEMKAVNGGSIIVALILLYVAASVTFVALSEHSDKSKESN